MDLAAHKLSEKFHYGCCGPLDTLISANGLLPKRSCQHHPGGLPACHTAAEAPLLIGTGNSLLSVPRIARQRASVLSVLLLDINMHTAEQLSVLPGLVFSLQHNCQCNS